MVSLVFWCGVLLLARRSGGGLGLFRNFGFDLLVWFLGGKLGIMMALRDYLGGCAYFWCFRAWLGWFVL